MKRLSHAKKTGRRRNPVSSVELANLRRANGIVLSESDESVQREHLAKPGADDVLYAQGAYGRKPTIKDWEDGKDFFAVNPPIWKGGPYFSISEAEFIYSLGYHHIVFGGAEGFEVDLVMEP